MANTMFVYHQADGFTPLSGIKIEIKSRWLFLNLLFFLEVSGNPKSGSLHQHRLINCFHCLGFAQQERMIHYHFSLFFIMFSLSYFQCLFWFAFVFAFSTCCWIVFNRCINQIVQSLCIFRIMLMRM